MASASKVQRNSPRKFAEKIALLNKKQQEDDAAFEQIIKEVEETRYNTKAGSAATSFNTNFVQKQTTKTPSTIQHRTNINSNSFGFIVSQTNSSASSSSCQRTESEDDENVKAAYDNLVASVSEFQDQLAYVTQQQQDNVQTVLSNQSAQTTCFVSQQVETNTPLYQQAPHTLHLASSPVQSSVQQNQTVVVAPIWRQRGTSFGSKCATLQVQRTRLMPNDFAGVQVNDNVNINSSTSFLRADRNWQKSCSDPALAPDQTENSFCLHQQITAAASCADELLACPFNAANQTLADFTLPATTISSQSPQDFYCQVPSVETDIYDTTSTLVNGELVPGIKICTIVDEPLQ